MGFDIDPTISLGNIISAFVAAGSVILAAWRISAKLNRMQWKLNLIWQWYAREHDITDSREDDEL